MTHQLNLLKQITEKLIGDGWELITAQEASKGYFADFIKEGVGITIDVDTADHVLCGKEHHCPDCGKLSSSQNDGWDDYCERCETEFTIKKEIIDELRPSNLNIKSKQRITQVF
jgi:hypothetical protein